MRYVKALSAVLVLFGVLCHRGAVGAGENAAIDCSVEGYAGTTFKPLYDTASRTAATFCKELIRSGIDRNGIDNRYVGSILVDFGDRAEAALDERGLVRSADYRDQFRRLDGTFARFDIRDMKLPEFIVESGLMSADVKGYFSPLDAHADRFVINNVDRCNEIMPGRDCRAVFEDFAAAFNPYRSAYNNIYDNSGRLERMASEWDRFLEVSKSQSALEVLLTTWANSDHFKKNHLVGPPTYQVIALHPNMVYDHMDAAPEGGKQKPGLAVEWIGVNFWDWKLPLGLSLASVYVDRAGFENTGHGVMLHIDNSYSVGWARHDEEDSIYITLDLLKLFEDKKRKYDRYMRYF